VLVPVLIAHACQMCMPSKMANGLRVTSNVCMVVLHVSSSISEDSSSKQVRVHGCHLSAWPALIHSITCS
jgi:hypothetical protein